MKAIQFKFNDRYRTVEGPQSSRSYLESTAENFGLTYHFTPKYEATILNLNMGMNNEMWERFKTCVSKGLNAAFKDIDDRDMEEMLVKASNAYNNLHMEAVRRGIMDDVTGTQAIAIDVEIVRNEPRQLAASAGPRASRSKVTDEDIAESLRSTGNVTRSFKILYPNSHSNMSGAYRTKFKEVAHRYGIGLN
jgi:hypothetical protein